MKDTRAFGHGVVINLPIFSLTTVKYQDGVIRFFFPKDVDAGQISRAA